MSEQRPPFAHVGPPWWSDRPVIIVGAGPSLAGFDFSRLRGLGYVLAVKEAVVDLPFADACFGLDLPWLRRRREYLIGLAARMPLYLAVPDEPPFKEEPIPGATYLRRIRNSGLSEDPGFIESGGNSGFGAFNLAVLKRAKRILLLGFDYSRDGAHYCPERYVHNPPAHNARYYPSWADEYRSTKRVIDAAGIVVTNASPASTVDAFERCTIDKAIASLQRMDRI